MLGKLWTQTIYPGGPPNIDGEFPTFLFGFAGIGKCPILGILDITL